MHPPPLTFPQTPSPTRRRRGLLLTAWAVAAAAWLGGCATPAPVVTAPAEITLLHTNDTHSRMESFKDGVLQAGVARRKTLVQQVRQEVGPDRVLLLDAGDFFQGTTFFNAWEGSESVMAMNDLGVDAATLGNHEFDLGPARLGRALRGEPIRIAGTEHATEAPRFALVVSNLDVSAEPALAGRILPHAVVARGGHRWGVVGAITPTLPHISSLGERAKVLEPAAAVNAATAALRNQGVNKIILLSHLGYQEDVKLAPQLSGVDVIVSGHDHALLGEAAAVTRATQDASAKYPGQAGAVVGPYPTLATSRDGEPMLVVSAYEWGRWLGRLDVRFDAQGRITGHKAAPLFVDGRTVAEEPALAARVAAYKEPVAAFSNVRVGESSQAFAAERGALKPFVAGLRTGETELGNLVADLMEDAARTSDGAVAAFTNGGGLRAPLPAGPINFGQALSVLPFGNTMTVVELSGQQVLDLLEASVAKLGGGGFLQVSRSLRWSYCADAAHCADALQANGRVTRVTLAGQPLRLEARYRLATNNFTAAGGDDYALLKGLCQKGQSFCRDTGVLMLDLLVQRLRSGQPLQARLDGRIERLENPMTHPAPTARNVLGQPLQLCSLAPLTGFFRDGSCRLDASDGGSHGVCARVTAEFLRFTAAQGNDLTTPRPEWRFPGLKAGDRWCLCALRWKEALDAGVAPPVDLAATDERVLAFVELADLQRHALPTRQG